MMRLAVMDLRGIWTVRGPLPALNYELDIGGEGERRARNDCPFSAFTSGWMVAPLIYVNTKKTRFMKEFTLTYWI